MKLAEWISLSHKARKKVSDSWDTLNGEGYSLAEKVGNDFKQHCRWNYEKVNILNRFTELIICVYLESDDFQDANRYPTTTYLGFKINYDTVNNYFEQ